MSTATSLVLACLVFALPLMATAQDASWEYPFEDRFYDTFDLAEALTETAYVTVDDPDGLMMVVLLVPDAGMAYPMTLVSSGPAGDRYAAAAPSGETAPGKEIRYFFEAYDVYGGVSVYPEEAPDETFEFSVLPINGSISDPGILVVDKVGARIKGDDGESRYEGEEYYRVALEILGYSFDVFDVRVPEDQFLSEGPDTSSMKYYDTQFWVMGALDTYPILSGDQEQLIYWLYDAYDYADRNLLMSGENMNYWLVEANYETLDFVDVWLATDYQSDRPGDGTADFYELYYPTSTGNDICELDGPEFHPLTIDYDVISDEAGIIGVDVVCNYRDDLIHWNAAVAYEDQVIGYRTVNLGFGFEYMRSPSMSETGLLHRVQFMEWIMEFFDKTPDVPPTDVPGEASDWRLAGPFPNPVREGAAIRFSTPAGEAATVGIYDVAGRRVTVLDAGGGAFADRELWWDGTDAAGRRVASGVYFVRLEPESSARPVSTRKLVLLR